MRRLFSARQKKILAFVAGGKCKSCGISLDKSFHADHIKPFSKGGETTTSNGQALCQRCNLSKGSSLI